MAQQVQVAATLGPEAAAKLLMAGAAYATESESSDPDVGPLASRISKSLSWLSKGRFEEAAKRYASSPLDAPARALGELSRALLRTALVLSDDLRPLAHLREGAPKFLDGISGQEAEITRELLIFWVSPRAMAIRRKTGLVSG